MRKLVLAVLALSVSATAQVSCGSGFTSSGACGLASFTVNTGNTVAYSSGTIILMPLNCDHCNTTFWEPAAQDITRFTTSFSFTPNDSQGLCFGINNTTNGTSGNGASLHAGASGECGMSQFCCSGGPNNVFFLTINRQNGNVVQIYTQNQCNVPGITCGSPPPINAFLGPAVVSTSPVNMAANLPLTATVTYDGYNLNLTLTDTASNTFSTSWKVNIPGIVGGNTGFVGFGTSTGVANTVSTTTLNNWAFSSGSPTLSSTQRGGSFAGTMQ